jgi:ABC-type amino acid transport substrate-binding protein
VSRAEYNHQAYSFAFPLSSSLTPQVNISLLRLEESGRVDRIVKAWLGDQAEN